MKGQVGHRLVVITILALVASVVPPLPGSAAPRWEEKRRRCFDPRHANHSVRVHCFQLLKLTDDGNKRTDYWTLHHCGTARSKDGYALTLFRLRVYPHEDSPKMLNWSDWDPRQDKQRDRCDNITVGISYVASVSWSHELCEEWDIKWFPEVPGRFHNSWKTGPSAVIESEREVAYAITVAVKQGKRPRWHFRGFTKTE